MKARDDKDFIRRGSLMLIIQNIARREDIPNTYDNIHFLQQLARNVFDLPSRWPDGGHVMGHVMRLDVDLVLKEDVVKSLDMVKSLEPERRTDIMDDIIDWIIKELDRYDGRP